MELEIIIIHVICCEFLQAMGHQEDGQCQMSDAEVMTTAIVAMLHFGGNYAKARKWLKSPVWCKNFISLDSSKWVGLSKFPKLACRNRMDVTRSISDDLGWIWCISVHR